MADVMMQLYEVCGQSLLTLYMGVPLALCVCPSMFGTRQGCVHVKVNNMVVTQLRDEPYTVYSM